MNDINLNDLAKLKATHYGLHLELFKLEQGSQKYIEHEAMISAIANKIKALEELEIEKKPTWNSSLENGLRYSNILGSFVKSEKGTEAEIKERMLRLRGDVASTPEQDDADKAWRKQCLLDPIKDQQWLNNIQVEAATGAPVAAGTTELETFLKKNNGIPPVSFAYIILGPNEQNHFVSFDIRNVNGKTEITYVDSNGDFMPIAERQSLEKILPGVDVKYLSNSGNKISEIDAVRTPENILRVQFDDYNCGLYTTNIVNMLKSSNGNAAEIEQGVARIKEISKNPDAHREILANVLQDIANNPEKEQTIQAKFAINSENILINSPNTKLASRSPSVNTANGYHPDLVSNNLQHAAPGKNVADFSNEKQFIR